jgi:hypothetical protein
MPAFSFKERFVPMLKDGTKTQTIRGLGRRCSVGQNVFLYYGLRTKYCTKIGEGLCTKVEPFIFHICGIVELNGVEYNFTKEKDYDVLCRFAWKDGFRPEGSTIKNPDGSFHLMLRFWKEYNNLNHSAFEGQVIHWKTLKNPTIL